MQKPLWMHHPHVRTGADLALDERFAEWATRAMGSLGYLIGQTVITAGWIVLNLVAFVSHWDPYPFILLNLAFSIQAAYAAPLILLAQRRSNQIASEEAHSTRLNTEAIQERQDEQTQLIRAIHDHVKGNE